MKKKQYLLTLLPLLLLTGCNGQGRTSSSSESSSSSSITSESSGSSSSSSTHSSSSSSSSSSYTPDPSDHWFDDKTQLECGSYSAGIPKNTTTVVIPTNNDGSTAVKYDTKLDVESPMRYIFKNSVDDGPSGHKCSPKMYAESSGGGVKFTSVGVGLETPLFTHTGFKLEIRIGISQVNNASDTPEKGKDPLHIYYFNSSNHYIGKDVISEGTITTSTAKNYVRVYNETSYTKDIAWFEVRMNTKPYKGSQSYNIGVEYISIKSWLGSV